MMAAVVFKFHPSFFQKLFCAVVAATVLSVQADGNGHDSQVTLTVQSEVGADIREALANAVISGGFGLMELRPAHLSLEEIFLQLTTTDAPLEAAA